jgi:hypothetical protein
LSSVRASASLGFARGSLTVVHRHEVFKVFDTGDAITVPAGVSDDGATLEDN